MRRALLLGLCPLALVACNENVFIKQKPKIVALPENIDFGQVVVDYEGTATLEIQNKGAAELTIEKLKLEDGSDGVFAFDFTGPLELAPDEVTEIEIRFTPGTYLSYADTLNLTSDDPDVDRAVLPIRLFGEGIDGPKPDIALDHLSIDFGTVAFGSTDYALFNVYNVGDADLIIDAVTVDGSSDFTFLDSLEGRTLGPGTSFSTAIAYEPSEAELGDDALVTILSNDPDEPVVDVVILGNGGEDYELPQAIFDCPGEVATLAELTFDGSASYDPNGYEPLFFTWSLDEQPEGSRSELRSAGETADFTPNLAGEYSISLVVTNALGLDSAPATCLLTAIPEDAIHVEMFWSVGDSDLDLHLAQNGVEIFAEDDDVAWCNPNPSWGESTSSTDDPSLDLDDQTGYGPENINIEEPQDGEYRARVHYFKDLGGGYATATVRIYLWGVLEAEVSQLLEDGEAWDVGVISWPDATWTEDAADLYTPSTNNCE